MICMFSIFLALLLSFADCRPTEDYDLYDSEPSMLMTIRNSWADIGRHIVGGFSKLTGMGLEESALQFYEDSDPQFKREINRPTLETSETQSAKFLLDINPENKEQATQLTFSDSLFDPNVLFSITPVQTLDPLSPILYQIKPANIYGQRRSTKNEIEAETDLGLLQDTIKKIQTAMWNTLTFSSKKEEEHHPYFTDFY